MKRFLFGIVSFCSILGLILLAGILLPATPRSKNNMLAFKPSKDSLLINTEQPRIIFMGGSNLVFGLNSGIIKDSLKMNPINNGLAISLGLVYLMDDILPYIKEGDVVVLVPEYHNFYGDQAFGSNDFFRFLMDIDKTGFTRLEKKHLPNLVFKSIPSYFQSKFIPKNYFYDIKKDFYGKQIFNEYGDSDFHWTLPQQKVNTLRPFKEKFNFALMGRLKAFDFQIKKRGAILIVTFPGCQETSMKVIEKQVELVEKELRKSEVLVIGSPERYTFSDSLMFDQAYHLNKVGVDIRTQLLIEDLKPIIIK